MTKTLLFIGGGIETLPGVQRARDMGLRVLVSDRNPQAPCGELAHALLIADTYDGPATVEAIRATNESPDGVLCLATDVPHTVAHVAQAFQLPGLSPESAQLAVDKLAMKDRFAQHQIAIPFYTPIDNAEQLLQLAQEHNHQLVIKPVDSRGARGVQRLTPEMDLHQAYDLARSYSPTGRVMAEAYLDGPQLSTESLVIKGQCVTPGMSDRNYELLDRYAPFFIENGGDLPSHLSEPTLQACRDLVARAAAAMGIHNGVVKGDLVVHRGQPYIIEVAARLSGGYFCTHSIPENTGVDLVGCAIRLALGEAVDPAELQPRYQRHVCQRYLFPKPGRVVAVAGVEEARKDEDLWYLEVRVQPGDVIGPMENHPARAGVLMTRGDSRAAAQAAAERAVDAIRIVTEPVDV